ncbi:MBOAT family O-acyltransferase [Marinivivus vitaminiproducens]|uniref:MBOAT family O-acyltransferase n=1 Tax=Marinivivus vitaminiproducens TaxID=3035935 RepID=UPI0027A216C5|nr:MBOAT family protein [Geminicoccaceae bacterium SCSIO 64248]
MLFVEPRFLVFFALVLAVHWSLHGNRARKLVLLAASYVFYGAWDWRFLGLILASTLVDYVLAIRIEASSDPRKRRIALATSLAGNLGLLFTFKYFDFFADSLADLLTLLDIPANGTTLDLVLPVGISFYTFQTMSYTIDVYRGDLRARRSLPDFALFVAFFPQLVAGPIVRARDFLPQLDARRRWPVVPVRACLVLFLIGFIKKAGISDNLAPYVDGVFADPAAYADPALFAGVVAYAVQIYCDFSGYSDMAVATAGLLGYRLPTNFRSPYLAGDITDFWRRWHVSLSTWLRDYLYIPLGGNRGSRLFQARNLMLTMVLGGLWHGAAWTFVIWGAMHGAALVAHKAWRERIGVRLPYPIGVACTFWWVCLAWIFFRAADLPTALAMAGRFSGLAGTSGSAGLAPAVLPVLACVVVIHVVLGKVGVEERLARLAPPVFALVYGVLGAVAVGLVPSGYRAFVYFQF